MQDSFLRAEHAFVFYFNKILLEGKEIGNGTKALYNVGFYIDDPENNLIKTEWRKWSEQYAQREWKWYLSGDRSVEEIKKYAPIWDKMHGGDNLVNSNYGWQLRRNDQLDICVQQLITDPETRQAWVSIFDGKEKSEYAYDTPCTLNIGFRILDGKLCMTVIMRSNDLWYGFCNDQYCFSMLQMTVASELGIPTGWYYHFAHDLHLYEQHWDAHRKFYK